MVAHFVLCATWKLLKLSDWGVPPRRRRAGSWTGRPHVRDPYDVVAVAARKGGFSSPLGGR